MSRGECPCSNFRIRGLNLQMKYNLIDSMEFQNPWLKSNCKICQRDGTQNIAEKIRGQYGSRFLWNKVEGRR